MSILSKLKAKAKQLVDGVRAARAPIELEPDVPQFACAVPGTDQAVVLPAVKTFDRPPTPEESRAEARRLALAYAREVSGKPEMTWKQAKVFIDRLVKEERRLEQEQRRDAAAPAPNMVAALTSKSPSPSSAKKIVIAGARSKVTV